MDKTSQTWTSPFLKNLFLKYYGELWLLFGAGVVMAHTSWLKWPDLVIDFGEQVYIAWRLSEGAVLYRDIVYFYGPLSSTIHASLFKLFGPQLIVLIIFNLILVAVLTVVIYRLFLLIGSRLSATVAGLTFLIVFAFAQYLWMGNHNFICSYVYDVTHGIFLSFIAAGQFVKFAKTRKTKNLILLGMLSGLVLLTKIEVSLAWVTAVLIGLLLLLKTWQCTRHEKLNYGVLFCLGLIFPFLLFTFYFAYHMGWSLGLEAMFHPWTYVFSTAIGSLSFYKGVMGTDALGYNLVLIFKYFLAWTLFLAILGVLNHVLRKPVARTPLLGLLAIVLFLLGLQTFQSLIPWLEVLRPLPFIMLGAAIVLVSKLWTKNHDSPDPVTTLTLATLTIFSTVLLLKISFKTHTYHYGAVLAMPATLIFFKFLIDDLPDKIKKISGDHLFFKGAMIAGVSLFAFNHFLVSASYYGKKDFPVASGGNTIISYNPKIASRALLFQITLDILNKEMKGGETLATFPTGTLLNFLVQKENTIDSISYNPGTWKLLGEQRILKDLQATPPTYIAIVYHDFLEFDTRFFGKDFGKDIYKLISDNYDSFQLIGKDPVKGESFGIHLFKLKAANPALV
ncbi:MAG: glycosyltransferase family 39 protein [Nitrospinota bacterium]|nr:glycosyltransferase family 39 protein [Nitrospinota bacterium]